MSLVWTRAKQSFFLSSTSGPFQSTSARQLSTPAGRGNVTDCQSSTGFKGDHCSHVPGSGRKYSGDGKNADNTTFDNGSYNTDSSMSIIQASTARKKSSAGLGENNKTVQILIRRCLQDTKDDFSYWNGFIAVPSCKSEFVLHNNSTNCHTRTNYTSTFWLPSPAM